MNPARAGAVARQLEVLWTSGTSTGLSDAQLLGRFIGGGEDTAEPAFRELVNRHGPMVMGVCRQILRRPQDADDAFQATFLVLVRKARSIRVGDSLAPWLYGVAYRTAHRARADAWRHRTADAEAMAEAADPAPDGSFELDVRPLLHEELARLPGKYREPIVLCHLEGKSHEEAARLLAWPVGTVSGRLSRGRQLLRSRLERRGVAVPSAMLSARWLTGTQAALTPPLVESTLDAAARFAAAGTIPASVQSLTQGVLRTMLLNKLKAVSLALVVVGAASGGVAAVRAPGASGASPAPPRPQIGAPVAPAPKDPDPIGKLPTEPISEIRLEGNTTIPADRIKTKLLSRIGQPFDIQKIDADVKTLMKTNWFSQVEAYHDEQPPRSGKFVLIFAVREMPLLTHVEFRGRKALPLKDLEDATGLKKGNLADHLRTRNAVHSIYRLYIEKGYALAEVELLEGGNPGDTRVVMQIFEGPKVKIASIDFVGCHFATPAMLRTHVASREPIRGLFGNDHKDLLDEDRQKLVDYYQGQGFFEVKVTPVTRPGDMPGEIDLTFVIDEGARYSVRKVIIQGNSRLETDKLMDGLELHSGRRFLADACAADMGRIMTRYNEIGRPFTEVGVEPRFTSEPGVVDLLYTIREEVPALRGKVLRREPVKAGPVSGEALDKNLLELLNRRLRILGYFGDDLQEPGPPQ